MNESKQIIITGISSELGGILAREFSKERGVQIIGTMRRKRVTADKFPKSICILQGCDLTDPQSCSKLAKMAEQRFRGRFGLVHCVGDFWHHDPFLDFGPKEAQTMFASHVTTFYNALQFLIPVMKRRHGGSVVAFSCNSTLYHYPWMTAFTASKSAVDSMVTSLANEYSGENIRLNSIRLSSLKTEPVRRSKPHGDFSHFTPPKDIFPIVRFLLSPAAYLVNGNSISTFKHSEGFYRQGYFERVSK